MRYDHAAPAVALLTLFGACTEGPTSLAPETDALVPLMDATARTPLRPSGSHLAEPPTSETPRTLTNG
jgi:hypothetical protein